MRTNTHRANEARRTPVHVIGGFLGSGKTTLLERLLAYEVARGGNPGVIVNEHGEADVDGRVVHEGHGASVDVVGLAGGCVCCDLTGEIADAVLKMGAEGRRSSIFVETTGLASLPQVAQVLRDALADPAASSLTMGRIVGVVDASRLRAVLASWSVAAQHLAGADIVLVNHSDRATAAQRDDAVRRVERLAPGSLVATTSFSDIDPRRVLGATRPRRPVPMRRVPLRDTTVGYQSSGFLLLRPVSLDRLEALARRFPRTLVRMKGLVRVANEARAFEIQWTPGQFRVRPYDGEVAEPYLVVIGRRLVWDRFFDGLDACLERKRRRSPRNGRIVRPGDPLTSPSA